MAKFELSADEVILYEGTVTSKDYKGSLELSLTSEKIVLEQEKKGLFKKGCEVVKTIELETVKFYNNAAQIKQHGSDVEIQSTVGNITITFSGILDARKFTGKAINAVTGTTLAKRVVNKAKDALETVDDTLGIDTRGAVKTVLQQGVKGVIINGIGKKKN